MLWLRAKSKSPCIHLNLFIFENEDWQIISHQLNPQNTSWRPLHSDLEQTTESVDDGVCCWLSLTPAGMLLPSSRYPTSIFICTERQRLTPFIRMMSKDAHNNEICKSFCESISSKSLQLHQLFILSLCHARKRCDMNTFPPKNFSQFRIWINFLDLVQQSPQDILGQGRQAI